MFAFLDEALKSTEEVLSEAAGVVRESVAAQTARVVDAISDSDFYRNHLAYVPPEEDDSSSRNNNNNATNHDDDRDEDDHSVSEKSDDAEDEERSDQDEEQEEYDYFFSSSQSTPSISPPPTGGGEPSVNTPSSRRDAEIKGKQQQRPGGEEKLLSEIATVPIEERIEAARHSIGWLNIKIGHLVGCSVDNTFLPGRTRPYLRVTLGSQQSWTSPVCENEVSPGEFAFSGVSSDKEEEENDHMKPLEIRLVAQDIHSDLFIRLHQKNVLTADRLLGTIVIPLSSIVPKVKDALARSSLFVTPASYKPYCLKSWCEFFPLPEEAKKYQGASSDINGTGMDRPDHPIGYLELDIELHLHGRISLWAGYAMKPYSPAITDTKPVLPAGGDIKMITAVVDSGRKFKRNFQRVKRAFSRVVSRGEHVWPAVRFLKRARTWEDPTTSLSALIGAFYLCILSPVHLLPLNLFLLLAASTFSLHGKHERERAYLVWNQDIHDPDDDLGTFQKVAKTIYLLEKFEKWMGIAADALERLGNVFSFADERVTLGALLFGFVTSSTLSLLLCFFPPGYLVFAGFLGWFFKGTAESAAATARSRLSASREQGTLKASQQQREREEKEVEEAGKTLRGKEGRLAVALAMVQLAKRAPTLAANVFARVPTDDELAHRYIAGLQRRGMEKPVVEWVTEDAPPERDNNEEQKGTKEEELGDATAQTVTMTGRLTSPSPGSTPSFSFAFLGSPSIRADDDDDAIWLREM